MNSFRCRYIATVLLAVALVAAGCSGDSLRFQGEKVKDPEQFLASIDQAWRSDLTKERVNVHKKARCYFSKAEESQDIDGLAFCGPARHYTEVAVSEDGEELTGTDAPAAVASGIWDTYAFEGVPIEGGYQLDKPVRDTIGAVLPPGVTLFRPDKQAPPADGDKLAAPPPPPAKSGFVGVTSFDSPDDGEPPTSDVAEIGEPKIESPTEFGESVIQTPYQDYRIENGGTSKTIVASGRRLSAAEGEEFLVASVGSSPGYWSDYVTGATDTLSQEAFTDEDTVDVNDVYTLTTPLGRTVLPISGSTTLAASVPKGDQTSTLTIESGGRAQSFSLRTGKATDAIPAVLDVAVGRQYSAQRKALDADGNDVVHTATFGNAWLTWFHPQKGWAPTGKAWLMLEVKAADYEWDNLWNGIEPDLAKSTRATSNGVAYPNVAKLTGDWFEWSDAPDWPVFEVAQDARVFRITYEPTFTYFARGADETKKNGKLKAMTFDVTFPAR